MDIQTKEKADQVVENIIRGRTKPFTMQGREYQGDCFYSDIDGMVSRLGAFSTPKQKVIQGEIYRYVCAQLRGAGFWVHS